MSARRSIDAQGHQPLTISRHINRSLLAAAEPLRAAGVLAFDPPQALRRFREGAVAAGRQPGDFAAAFTRTFRQLLGPHGYQLVATPKPELVVFENKDGTRV